MDGLQQVRESIALKELVEALDKTSWSSWQSTAPFSKPLDRARAILSERQQS